MMIVSASKQKGMTLIGLTLVLGVLAFFVLLTLKLLPPYLEYFKVGSILDSIKQEPDLAKMEIPEIRRMMDQRFSIDSVSALSPKDVVIEKQGAKVSLAANYEARVHIMGNADAVLVFSKEIEIVGGR